MTTRISGWVRRVALGAIFGAFAASALPALALTTVPGVCRGKQYAPTTDTDWNDAYPITIAGTQETGSAANQDPALMLAMPPICVCPGPFGFPEEGIGITYWQPMYVAEAQNDPGCLSSMGGEQVLSPAYQIMQSELTGLGAADGPNSAGGTNRMQIHWYKYPVFAMMGIMASVECNNNTGFDLAYMTELDPLWQDDTWSAIFTPEAVLFSNMAAQSACSVDSVASTLGFTLDSLFWCQGTWGSAYPFSGNSSQANSDNPWSSNNELVGRFIARSARMGLQQMTIGPGAICSSSFSPIWIKSQYRFDTIGPIPRFGRAVVVGSAGLDQEPPVANTATQSYTTTLIWQGMQCCMMGVP